MESNWEENDPSSPSFHPQLFPFTYYAMNRIPSGLTRKFVSVFKAGTLESWGSSEETSQQTIWAWVRHSSSRLSRKVLSRTVSRLSPATSPLLFQSLFYQTDFVSNDGLSIPSLAETVRTVIKRIETLSGVTINRCWFYYNFSNAFWRDWKFLHEFSRIESTRETLCTVVLKRRCLRKVIFGSTFTVFLSVTSLTIQLTISLRQRVSL